MLISFEGIEVKNLEECWPWFRFIERKYRLFHAEVTFYAPKDRTLFNYQVIDKWEKLADFLELKESQLFEFPHENKLGDAEDFISNIWENSDYVRNYKRELNEYLAKYL